MALGGGGTLTIAKNGLPENHRFTQPSMMTLGWGFNHVEVSGVPGLRKKYVNLLKPLKPFKLFLFFWGGVFFQDKTHPWDDPKFTSLEKCMK